MVDIALCFGALFFFLGLLLSCLVGLVLVDIGLLRPVVAC